MAATAIAVLAAEIAALGALLVVGLLVYRAFPQRYLLIWNGAWLLYILHVLGAASSWLAQGLLPAGMLLAAQGLMTGAIGEAVGRRALPIWLLPLAALSLLGEAIVASLFPGWRGWPSAGGYLLLDLIAAAWVIEYGRRRVGWGPWLLAVALLLRLIDLPGHPAVGIPLLVFSAASAVLTMVSMLVLAMEAARQHLRWGAAPGLMAALAADCVPRGRLAPDALHRLCAGLQRIFDAAYARLHVVGPGHRPDAEAALLLDMLPRSSAGLSACTTVIGCERGPDAEQWLQQRGLRWAILVPIPQFRAAAGPAGVFVLGYRTRRWTSPEIMEALAITGRQLGMVLENSSLLGQLSRAYRDWLSTVDAIGDYVLVHDARYRIRRVNRALADRLGKAPVKIIGHSCREVLPCAPASPWNDCPFCELPRHGETFDANFQGYFLVATSRYPREEASEILHVVKDITDRKRAEEKYRTMFEKVHEGVFISTRAGRFLEFNEAFARMLGYERDELLAMHIPSLYVSPQGRDQYLRLIDTQGYVSDFESRLRRKNGEEMIGLETSFGMRDETGQIVQLQGFLLDITARKQAEEQLQKHAAMLAAVNEISERLSGSLDAEELIRTAVRDLGPVFGCDTVSGYLLDRESGEARRVASCGFLSEAGQQPFSFPLSADFLAMLGADRRAVLPLLDLPPVPELPRAVQQAEGLRSVFVIPLRADHTLGAVIVGWRQPRVLSAAEESLLKAIGRQLSAALENAALYQQTRQAYEELRRTQEQLLQSEKMAAIGQLVSGVAHELNNPLTAIIGYGQLLGSLLSGRPAEYTGKLLHQAQRTRRIIQDLLSFSRQSKPQRQPLDLNHVVEEALLPRDYDLRTAHIRIECSLDPELPAVHGDLHQLEQVFLNIVTNACDELQARGGPGTIWVHSYAQGRHAAVEIRDDGSGLKDPGRVFDPFYTTKPVGKGTGLGLSICYGIIKEHGGEITAANHPSGGAVFTVRLPIAAAAAASYEL
jgi:two-component system NtrC family sensor kinase